jgi:hypothetical protein
LKNVSRNSDKKLIYVFNQGDQIRPLSDGWLWAVT